jgi:hypothetical protein
MNVTAYEGFNFSRWMHELDSESRVRLDRFLEMAAEAMPKGKGVGRNPVSD